MIQTYNIYKNCNNHIIFIFVTIFSVFVTNVRCNLWCYSCVSSEPGCTLNKVDWLIHSAISCPRSDDKCVKIIDQKGSDLLVTRDCLSNIIPYRRDIPADRFEGCRPAATQPKLAVFVENSVDQLDLKKDYFDKTTYCFCEFDEWCNHSTRCQASGLLLVLTIALVSAFISLKIVT
ncbi:uncharacterized protein LOC128952931 [Oppia nitens]|uniref:uncharacterized protein LOC128952931 n=1 Tax=Oppia nitens TaxID=1686743 RepID=UPI0023DCB024|nr:uncharacterized protein LOC128952931 [Oppia nitens]